MRKNYVRTVGIFLAAAALWGCGSDKKTLTLSEAEKEVPAEAVPEEVKGRLDVYTSMARAVKYNINATRQNMKSKVEPGDPKLSARDLIRSVLNVKAGQESQLYDALRVLDFAVRTVWRTIRRRRRIICLPSRRSIWRWRQSRRMKTLCSG